MAIRTLGLTGRNYSTLAAAAAFFNAQSFAENEVLEVYNDGGPVADTATVTLGGWTANGFSLTIRPASGQGIRHNVNKLTNAYRYDTANGAALTNSVSGDLGYVLSGANLIVEDLQLRVTNSGAAGCVRATSTPTIRRCILRADSAAWVVPQARNIVIQDSLIINGNGGGLDVTLDNVDVDNCTIVNIATGGIGIRQLYTQSTPPRVRNSVLVGFSTAAQGTYRAGSTNNATTTASWTGTGISGTTGIVAADEFESLTAGSEDLRLKTTASATMKTSGASGVGTGLDGVATTRGATNRSIGAWEAPATGTPPSVTTHPSNQTVTAPATATFTAAASGSPTPTVQWQRNGVNISGATSTSYTTPATTVTGGSANNGDQYRAVFTNASGTATTNAATLTVNAAGTAPNITVQPGNQTVTEGATATFSVTASGSGTLTYQWRKNGTNIGGATSSSYTTPATVLADNGALFSVVVTGDTAPPATSNNATLTVNAAPSAAGFDFNTAAGLVFGALSGSLTGLSREVGVSITTRVHNATTGALITTLPATATNSSGRLPRLTSGSVTAGTTYLLTFVWPDGAVYSITMAAT